jgi:protein TonB
MSADLLSDSHWSNHSHRGWTTLISFSLQVLVVSCLLFLPLLYTEGLPRLAMLAPLLVPAPPRSPLPASRHAISVAHVQSNLAGTQLLAPSRIPRDVTMLEETVPPPLVDASALGVVSHGSGATDGRGNVLDSIPESNLSVALPPPPAEHHFRVSRMMEGNLVHRVQPDYPALARLIPAAVDAVRQWRYRPYVLNGKPVEVETQVTVNFVLSGE